MSPCLTSHLQTIGPIYHIPAAISIHNQGIAPNSPNKKPKIDSNTQQASKANKTTPAQTPTSHNNSFHHPSHP
jgi:hypothetical protein